MVSPGTRRLARASVLALLVTSPFSSSAIASAEPRPLVLRSATVSEPAPKATPLVSTTPTRFSRPVTSRANGPAFLHVLGVRKATAALVSLPPGTPARDLGLEPVVEGVARLRGEPAVIDAFALAHPSLRVEVAPPLHILSERIGSWVRSSRVRLERGVDGTGAYVGVADTGLDVTHPDMRDAAGKTRVAWLLDLSLKPLGLHPELEDRFGIKNAKGEIEAGAVLARADIDKLLGQLTAGGCIESNANICVPVDEVGHGTHVTGIAAATGVPDVAEPGIAPGAGILFVRVTRDARSGIENDDLVRAVEFMFDRADADGKPAALNLSLGSDFGPHDGTLLWEQTVAKFVGPDKPGHAIVAAAGNSGSIVETPIHQSVRVSPGVLTRVPVRANDRDPNEPGDSGQVQIWVTFRRGAKMNVGLEGPDGTWIEPVGPGVESGKNTPEYNAGVIHGTTASSVVPVGSNGAIVVWTGRWPSGTYNVVLEGEGMAELYLQGVGDAAPAGRRPSSFTNGVREGTVNLPATHPSIIGVGCTTNLPRWRSIAGSTVALRVPLLDDSGSLPAARVRDKTGAVYQPVRDLLDGEVCWFSSAGPTATGVQKPEISAPGAMVPSSMSRRAKPGQAVSIFTTEGCPQTESGKEDNRCLQLDEYNGMALGTSMSSPVVAGVIALLLQRDPTLTQDKIVALLQGGAHRFRGSAPFDDQAGPGEVDAWGSLDALDRMKDPKLALPSRGQSWLVLSSTYVPADGSTDTTAIVELRTESGEERADLFGDGRLRASVSVDGVPVEPAPALQRRGPGVWTYTWTPPPGLGGSRATFGATFDGAPIVEPRSVPIATDGWTARYPNLASGSSCAVAPVTGVSGIVSAGLGLAGLGLGLVRRRRRLTRRRG